ncbi:glycosyltransferase family 4 protein [Diplocloster agilis]|uniref:Glycosyltransferase family 4 protein n=1 Tax=Diplocloster agilis TaxID=2850323 RepID=A0A949K617_9FIRM|nr:glycosyltransferase family 4 protein [Diplocloster agilis]MBU9735532.1 glycosyltransferase family 4 protein [Diplocloster agilis]
MVQMKKRLLIYAHYYVPDTASTGQLLKELAEGMRDTFEITVICVVPSYLGTIKDQYKTQKYYRENINGIDVIRIRVPEFSKTDKLSRIINILAYFFGAMAATFKVGKQDYVFSISQPPILGGLIGVWGKWMKHAKYIYNIQDFNPEQTIAVGYSKNQLILKAMMWLDKFSCKRSNLVITVGRDLIDTLNNRFKNNPPKSALINNWIDEKEIYPLETSHKSVEAFKRKYSLNGKFVIMYSGNIGLYYDLENLIKVIKKFKPGTKAADGREVVFCFVGAGSVLEDLVKYKEANHMDNVVFIPYQAKADLNYSLNAGDVHWCVNAKGIKGVSCPSKYYGVAAVGKPVLGVLAKGSEVRSLIETSKSGLCCEPGEYEIIKKNIQWFIDQAGSDELKAMGMKGYEYLIDHLTKEKSISRYVEEILKL